MWGFWWPSASHRLKLQVSYSCNLRSLPSKLSSHITAPMTWCGQMFSKGVLAQFLTLRFNQNVFCLPCCFLFKIVVLTRVHTDNKGLQKLTLSLKIGTAAMFICTKRKKQVLLGRFVSFGFFLIKRTTFCIRWWVTKYYWVLNHRYYYSDGKKCISRLRKKNPVRLYYMGHMTSICF